MKLQTERLILRLPIEADRARFVELFCDAHSAFHISTQTRDAGPGTRSDVDRAISADLRPSHNGPIGRGRLEGVTSSRADDLLKVVAPPERAASAPIVAVIAPTDERVLSVERAGTMLGLSRASAYRAAHRWIETQGAEGLPVVVLSARRLVVPVAALHRLLETALTVAS